MSALGARVDGVAHGYVGQHSLHRGVLWWRFAEPRRVISSASVGGGLRSIDWLLNVGVRHDFDRTDLGTYTSEITDALATDRPAFAGLAPGGVGLLAPSLGFAGVGFDGWGPDGLGFRPRTDQSGSALFTAVPVERREYADRDGVSVCATVGVTRPTWPADETSLEYAGRRLPDHSQAGGHPEGPPEPRQPPKPGTINIVAFLPVPLTDSALVQAAATVTEAKAQACVEFGLAGTGTASDALVVVSGLPFAKNGAPEEFGGVRSTWGSRLALAVHEAVTAGLRRHP